MLCDIVALFVKLTVLCGDGILKHDEWGSGQWSVYLHTFTGKVLKAMLHFDLGCVNQIVQKLSMTVSLTLL